MFNELYNELDHLRGKDMLTIEDCEYMMSLNNGALDLTLLSDGDHYMPKLPAGLVVQGSLNIPACAVAHYCLPEGLVIHGSLHASSTTLTTLPDDIVVGGDIYLGYSDIISLPDGLKCNATLDISRTKINKLPDGLVVKEDLYIRQCSEINELPSNLFVGRDLVANSSGLSCLGEGAVIGRHIYLTDTPIDSLPDGLIVNGNLSIIHTQITRIPSGTRVNGSIYLCESVHKNIDKIYVGDDVIVCDGIIIVPDTEHPIDVCFGKNCIIGHGVYGHRYHRPHYVNDTVIHIESTDNIIVGYHGINVIYQNPSHVIDLHEGDYVEGKYIYADDRLTLIKGAHKVGKYTIYKGFFKGYNVITDGEYYAHCDKIKDGIADIEYKRAEDRGIDAYETLTINSVVTKDEAITMYRVITGACQQGTQVFIDSLGDSIKDEYTISEIIELTSGRYGSDTFREFFTEEE